MDIFVFIVSCILFYIVSIPIHEFGHLVFGLLTGYRFSSFKLLNFTWIKEGGKITLKKSRSNFPTGQCLMEPPKEEQKFKFVCYNLGGGFLNLITAAILSVCMVVFFQNIYQFFFLYAGAVMNIVTGLMNLIPLNLIIPNDGMNVLTASKSDQARHGFYIMLSLNQHTMDGKRYKDFDAASFAVAEPADYNNFFVAYTVICEASRLYDMGRYDDCIQTYKALDLNKLQTYYRNSIKLDFMYYYIIHRPDFEKSRKIYTDPKMKKYLKISLPTITRVLSAYEFFINNDKEKGTQLLGKAKEEAINYPNKGIALMEKEYLTELEKIMTQETACKQEP